MGLNSKHASTRIHSRSSDQFRTKTLRDQAVRPKTLHRYNQALRMFFHFLQLNELVNLNSYERLDEYASMFIEHLYAEGEPKSWVSNLLASLQHHFPHARGKLCGSWRLLRVWHRLRPPTRAAPISPQIVRVMAALLLALGDARPAVCILLAFHCYSRTGEMLSCFQSMLQS